NAALGPLASPILQKRNLNLGRVPVERWRQGYDFHPFFPNRIDAPLGFYLRRTAPRDHYACPTRDPSTSSIVCRRGTTLPISPKVGGMVAVASPVSYCHALMSNDHAAKVNDRSSLAIWTVARRVGVTAVL